jgi:hypothetical protein
MPFWMGWIVTTPQPQRPEPGKVPAIPFFDFTVFLRAADLSMSGGRNAVKCKANMKYGHLSSKGAAGYFLPSVRLNPIGWPTSAKSLSSITRWPRIS